jgi:hypothetical protein
VYEELRPLLFSIAYRMVGSRGRRRGHRLGGVPAAPPRIEQGNRDRAARDVSVNGHEPAAGGSMAFVNQAWVASLKRDSSSIRGQDH